jgi:membrane associated rhomboid family serine protease
MGLHDRDYYREPRRGFIAPGSVVFWLIAVNAGIWVGQLLFFHSDFRLEDIFACHPADIFQKYYLWQLLTANFLHAARDPWHILWNMYFLFLFGRDLEEIYGRRDFLIFYLAAGVLAMLAEAAILYFGSGPGEAQRAILGASGSVMAVVVLFTLFFPTRKIYLFIIPVDAWLLCVMFILFDLSGAVSGGRNVANFAHLAGAAFGAIYRVLDLRTGRIGHRTSNFFRGFRWRLKARRRPRLLKPEERSVREAPGVGARRGRDPVSARIDELLEKISRTGQDSLTREEREYLQKNSGKYRSED